ncbi:glycoside hydrolase [Parvularcula flava]|uniref:Glycoside hydrolase n=1 Tax=Aquisalinus luteolus TaxID=1566827 RepID=A0A8J3A289_9PROT|nr:glycoside hydrolase family 9 protein [Aquisalinus luteolus]NHK27953.1 glycoside hydrolase [Aquisalinus luteolus]GGH97029.1 hypothetical protein GCM10011355_17250 [Aquisalinus luteolus]
MRKVTGIAAALCLLAPMVAPSGAAAQLELNDKEYFEAPGLNVTVFADYYPDGHQTGVTIIQHGQRVAANGDVRLEASPGQWSPVPKAVERTVDAENGIISQRMAYPDESKDRTGFNPIIYPDLDFEYEVKVRAGEGNSVIVSVDLDEPIPDEWAGRIGFNFELFPPHYFGKAFLMDGDSGEEAGYFPVQPNGPLVDHHGETLAEPLATGTTLSVAPDDPMVSMVISSDDGLELWDGRTNHNNGWYIVRTPIPAGATEGAIEWTITPNVETDWMYEPVVQVSQLGYGPNQPKRILIEQDKRDTKADRLAIYRLTPNGREEVSAGTPEAWGEFLRYNYLEYDFSDITEAGAYVAEYRGRTTHAFRIGNDVFGRHAWAPTLEYYLPVQMCHMRVNEKYRVWHGLDHQDDALMAPVDLNHFDGYVSGLETMTPFEPGEHVPGLNAGGWHDAGDYDLRVESQIGTVWLLTKMIEEFGLDHDATMIDQDNKLVELHQRDGVNDMLQQVEHGLLSVVGGYEALGRLYRGIIVPTNRQYVMLGEANDQTDGFVWREDSVVQQRKDGYEAMDDRWVFTEDNPSRELYTAAGLAAASRVMRGYDDDLAERTLAAARGVYEMSFDRADSVHNRVFVLSELYQTTGDTAYLDRLVEMEDALLEDIDATGWMLASALPMIEAEGGYGDFLTALDARVAEYQEKVRERSTETPYGVPYEPDIWGAGWTIQRFGVEHYFFTRGWPQHADEKLYLDALNFVLGVHPGENTISFVSGVGANSALIAYGTNRADWSFIPGGSISGTALIRPDLPELKDWPFFWQQTEYVMGGGATNYMFLALAANALYAEED